MAMTTYQSGGSLFHFGDNFRLVDGWRWVKK